MAQLAENHYGKSRVRLLKVSRDVNGHSAVHHVSEWTVGVYLTGNFRACYLEGDNTGLLATDTMKNTVYAVARTSAAATLEDFALELARFLASHDAELDSVRVTIQERTWSRIDTAAPGAAPAPQDTAFQQRGPETPTTSVLLVRGEPAVVVSGISGLVILKTAHSAFAGFRRDELTTLPDTQDRLFATEAAIEWLYWEIPQDFAAARAGILHTLLATFAAHDSLSVQQTLFAMGEAALAAEPRLAELTLTMPNRHNLPVDFSRLAPPFNYSNDNTIFVPTDEPHGHIHARVVR